MKTTKFKISGMSCAACQANVEKAVCNLQGTESAQVNLLTEQLTIVFDEEKLTEQNITDAINNIGYGAVVLDNSTQKNDLKSQWQYKKEEEQKQLGAMKKRLVSSVVFLCFLMYISMGHMLSLPLPHFLHGTENALLNA